MASSLLSPPLGIQAPITDLERLWLETSCYYALLDENVMADEEWDQMAVELWERRGELSPYFCHAVRLKWPQATTRQHRSNPLKTAMSVDWGEGLPALIAEGIRKEGPKRLAMWRSRIRGLLLEADRGTLGRTWRWKGVRPRTGP